MSDDTLFNTLNHELDIIHGEVVDLRLKQHIYWELQKIIGANSKINVPNEFYDWIAELYGASMVVAIRRQLDGRSDTISFRRFLEQIKRRPHVVTRERYRALFTASTAEDIDADFDALVGVGEKHLSSSAVRCDLESLSCKVKNLKDYANTWIAHRAKRGPAVGSRSFRDIDDAIEVLDGLLRKYLHLFRSAIGSDSLLPVVQTPWKAVFRVPWLLDQPTDPGSS